MITETFFQVDGKVKYGPLEPGYKEYITMLSKWYAEDLIDKDFATKQIHTQQRLHPSNRTGAFYRQYIDFTGLKAKAADSNYNLVAPTPARNAGDSVHVRQLNTMSGSVNWVVQVMHNR